MRNMPVTSQGRPWKSLPPAIRRRGRSCAKIRRSSTAGKNNSGTPNFFYFWGLTVRQSRLTRTVRQLMNQSSIPHHNMKKHTNTTTGAGNTTAAQFRITYCDHATYDPVEHVATFVADAQFSEDQVAAMFSMRHSAYVLKVERDQTQIVSHPDLRGSFAILDIYGDYVRNYRGFVQPFTKSAAQAALSSRRAA